MLEGRPQTQFIREEALVPGPFGQTMFRRVRVAECRRTLRLTTCGQCLAAAAFATARRFAPPGLAMRLNVLRASASRFAVLYMFLALASLLALNHSSSISAKPPSNCGLHTLGTHYVTLPWPRAN
jgi:hypothetical protein